MKQLCLFMLLMGIGFAAQAQDKIFTRAGKTIECKVLEIGLEDVRYQMSEKPDGAIVTIKKIDIQKIVFADGTVEEYRDELEDPTLYADNNKNAWKFDFLSPLFGHTGLMYERSIKPGFSLEGGIGIIGLGRDLEETNPAGAYIRFGPRFMRTPDYRQSSLRYYHVLKGAYVQPQVLFGTFASDVRYLVTSPNGANFQSGRETTTYGTLMLTFGKQNVFANRFLVDFYAGFGYGFQNTSDKNRPFNTIREDYRTRRTFGALTGNDDMPIAASLGIKIGFLTR